MALPLVVVVAVAAAAGWWFDSHILSYDAVGYGDSGWHSIHRDGDDFAASDVVPVSDALASAITDTKIVFHYRQNAEFSYGFRLSNNGPRTVRVTALPPVLLPEADVTGVYMEPAGPAAGRAFPPSQFVAFRPFTLRPRQSRSVEFRYRMTMCAPADGARGSTSSSGSSRQKVRFTVNGISRQRAFPLRQAIAVVTPGSYKSCDERQAQVHRRDAQGRCRSRPRL